jgi:uncharacterized membrane protein (UPF0182 family)
VCCGCVTLFFAFQSFGRNNVPLESDLGQFAFQRPLLHNFDDSVPLLLFDVLLLAPLADSVLILSFASVMLAKPGEQK